MLTTKSSLFRFQQHCACSAARQSYFSFIRQATTPLVALFVLISICLPSFVQASELVDRVVAIVNDDVITLSELEEELAPTLAKIKEQVPLSQQDETIKKAQGEFLKAMIDRKLLFQHAAERQVEIAEAEINSAIDRILEENNMTVDQFREQLKAMGATEEKYRERVKSQMLRSKLVSYEIRSKVVITNEQIEQYYREHYGQYNTPEGYHILQFGSAWGDKGRSASAPEAKKRAEQLREMILAGENFSDIAKNYSDLPSAADGGDIGVFHKDELADYMWQAIKDLKAGQLSDIIETPSGYQFFKLLSASSGGVVSQAPLDSVREEIRATLYDQELQERFATWVKQLRENSYVEEFL